VPIKPATDPGKLPKASQQLLDSAIRTQAASAASGLAQFSDMNTARMPLLYLDPMFDQILIMFPQDNLRELNRRLRHYYKYDPYVRSIIDFHTETPISDFELRCPQHKIAEKYYNDFKDRKNLVGVCINAMREYHLLGEYFGYGNWDPDKQEYSEFIQLPPEEVEVHSAYISSKRVHVLRPNRELGKIMKSMAVADQMVAQLIGASNPQQAKALAGNKPLVLDSNRLIVLQREMAGYSNRGVSPLLSVVKDLMFQDFLNLFRTVFIQRHSYPLKIFKIGSESRGWVPHAKMMREFQQQLASAIADPDYNLVTHPFVQVDAFTGHDKILPLIPYYDLVKQRIFAGLFASEAIVSGEKTPYAAGITFMRGLMNRYLTIRNNLEIELKKKVFEPLARKHEFTDKDGNLVIPKFFWHKANLLSSQAIQQMLISLREKGEVPARFVMEMFGIELDDLLYQFEKEEGTRVDQVYRRVMEDMVTKNAVVRDAYLNGKNLREAIKESTRYEMETGKKPPEVDGKVPKAKVPAPGVAPSKVAPVKAAPPEIAEGKKEVPAEAAPKPAGVPSLPEEGRRPRPGEAGEGPAGGEGGAPGAEP
jgi:hypothetical protein